MNIRKETILENKEDLRKEVAKLRLQNQFLREILEYHQIKIPETIDKYIDSDPDDLIGYIADMAVNLSTLNSAVMMNNQLIAELILKD